MSTEPDDQIIVRIPEWGDGIPVDLAALERGKALCFKRENGAWVKEAAE